MGQSTSSNRLRTPDVAAYTLLIDLPPTNLVSWATIILVLFALVLVNLLLPTRNSYDVENSTIKICKYSSIFISYIANTGFLNPHLADLHLRHFSHLDIRDVDLNIARINLSQTIIRPCRPDHAQLLGSSMKGLIRNLVRILSSLPPL